MRAHRVRYYGGYVIPGVVLLLAAAACQQEKAAQTPKATTEAMAPTGASNDALLLAATRIALPPEGLSPSDLPEPGSPGATLEAAYCGQCHALPSPAMHSATDWPRVLRRMWLRMDRLPDSLGVRTLDEGDRIVLLNYLTANALQVSQANLPAGPGRDDFVAICSRCHALPDIKIHEAKDWPTVFMRMERNMEKMHVSPPTTDQGRRILLYLEQSADKS